MCTCELAIATLIGSLAVLCPAANNDARDRTSPATGTVSGEVAAGSTSAQPSVGSPPVSFATAQALDKVYQDESHCLTLADMRGDQDMGISCFCRDAIAISRYVWFTYLLPGKDPNLNGVFLVLRDRIGQQCGQKFDAFDVATRKNWNWNGPEVVRTYPPEDVIARIRPEKRNGKSVGRWIPFTVQLVHRDDQGRVIRTENYSSREFEPIVK